MVGILARCQLEELLRKDPISPLLFVIVIEYLTRIMKQLDKIPNFNCHTMCGNLKITSLCFAYDLLMFTRGDTISIAHI